MRARAQGKRVAVSGSGNVAIYTVEKLLELGATVLTVSDSTGYVYFEDGLTKELLEAVNDHKVIKRGRLSDFKSGAHISQGVGIIILITKTLWKRENQGFTKSRIHYSGSMH